MFQLSTGGYIREPAKLGVLALLLFVPGSFLALSVWWLVAQLKGRSATNTRESSCEKTRRARNAGFLQRLHRWWQLQDASERYLAQACNHAELERRMRVLERGSGGPAFVTFNH